jgi:hypothetical protein
MSSVSKYLLAFKMGYDLIPSRSEREYEAAKTRYTNAMADYYATKNDGDSAYDAKRIENIDSQIASRKARDATYAESVKKSGGSKKSDLFDGYVDDGVSASAAPSSAIPAGPGSAPAEDEAPVAPVAPPPEEGGGEVWDPYGRAAEPEPIEETPGLAKGGAVPMPRHMVRRYANGGGVVEGHGWAPEENNPMPHATRPETALPPSNSFTAQPMSAPQPQAAPPAEELSPGFSYTAAIDAAQAGIRGMGVKRKGIPDGKADADAATIEEIKATDRVVDPGKRLSEAQRVMKKLAWGFEAAHQKGDPKAAGEVATSLMKTYKRLSQGYAQMGKTLEEKGDTDGALQAFVRAYAYIPDGREIKISKTPDGRFAYKYTDNVTGEVISKGIQTPDEMLAAASNGFMNRWEDLVTMGRDESKVPSEAVRSAIGGTNAAPDLDKANTVDEAKLMQEAHEKRTAPAKLEDRTKASEAVEAAWIARATEDTVAGPNDKMIKAAASHITLKGNVTPDEAIDVAEALSGKVPYQVVETGDMMTVRVNDRNVTVPKDQFIQLVSLRTRTEDAARKEEVKDGGPGYGPAVKRFGKKVAGEFGVDPRYKDKDLAGATKLAREDLMQGVKDEHKEIFYEGAKAVGEKTGEAVRGATANAKANIQAIRDWWSSVAPDDEPTAPRRPGGR